MSGTINGWSMSHHLIGMHMLPQIHYYLAHPSKNKLNHNEPTIMQLFSATAYKFLINDCKINFTTRYDNVDNGDLTKELSQQHTSSVTDFSLA